MKMIEKILPKLVDDRYLGSKIALYGFYPILAIYTFRSIVHFLKEDAGLRDIASIITFPLVDNLDPNNVIYLFGSLWGASQLLLLLFYVVIITRYKSLLSFLWITVILDVLFRFISGYLHPLTFEYYSYTPPGKLSNLPILIYSLVMLNFSLKHSKK